MIRTHTTRPNAPGHRIIVGWNGKLRTFFAEVWDRQKEAAGSDAACIARIGVHREEVIDVLDLRNRLRRYAYLNADTKAALLADRDQGRAA